MALSKLPHGDHNLLQRGKDVAKELTELLRDSVKIRKRTADTLRSIADDLNNVNENVNIAKIVGTSVSILGGIGAIGAIVFTGGLAAPLVIGAAGAIAGGITNATAGVIGNYVSKEKIESAQKALNADKHLTEKIEKKFNEMKQIAGTLSKTFKVSEDQMIGLLMCGGQEIRALNPLIIKVNAGTSAYLSLVLVETGISSTTATLGKGASVAVAEISTKALARSFGVALMGAFVIWDAVTLVTTIVDTVHGSPTEAASSLRNAARKIDESIKEIVRQLKELRTLSNLMQEKLIKRFEELIQRASSTECPSKQDKDEIGSYIKDCASSQWKGVASCRNLEFIKENVAKILRHLLKYIEDETNKQTGGELTIILIGHGSVNPNQTMPVQFYFMNYWVRDITLYSPWGCTVDANVVYGIATRLIQPQTRQFLGQPRGPFNPALLPEFNKLRWNPFQRIPPPIPTATFYPIKVSDPAYQDLLLVHGTLQAQTDGLVIPYMDSIIPLPEAPLWVMVNALAIIGWLKQIRIKFRYAACLSWDRNTPIGQGASAQYCYVPKKDPDEMMSCSLPRAVQPTHVFLRHYANFNRHVYGQQ